MELIVEESEWEPRTCPGMSDKIVRLRVARAETEVRRQVKGTGGRWNPEQQVWEVRYERVRALGLTDRIGEARGI